VAFHSMGTGIDTSTAAANARGPGGALVRRATLRVSLPRTLEGPLGWVRKAGWLRQLGWLRREARRRLLANDPRTATIRSAVGWSSLAGAVLGVVLAFVAAAPEDTGRGTPRRGPGASLALAHRPAARPASPGRPLGASREQTQASALPPPAAPTPSPVRPDDLPPATLAMAPKPAVAVTPFESAASPAPGGAPAVAAAPPAPSAEDASQGPVVRSATSLPAPSDRTSSAKGRRREGPGSPAALARTDATGASGSHGADADELVWLAERAFQAGHAAEAIRLGQKALAAGAGARAQLTIAGAYFDMREFDRARGAYEAVLAEDPGNQAARAGLDISRSALARSIARAP